MLRSQILFGKLILQSVGKVYLSPIVDCFDRILVTWKIGYNAAEYYPKAFMNLFEYQ